MIGKTMVHLKVEHLRTSNWEGAFRGMRNPKESWAKSDSAFCSPGSGLSTTKTFRNDGLILIGPKDFKLAMKLQVGGEPHRKFVRQIFISCDIIAPWLFWKEYETYQIGTVENSTSQMHKMGSKILEAGDFVFSIFEEYLPEYKEATIGSEHNEISKAYWETVNLLDVINEKILRWRSHKNKGKHGNIFWRDLIECIPGSFIYRRTCTLNYEVMTQMYRWRNKHKLIEWREFCRFMVENLPYSQLFTGKESG